MTLLIFMDYLLKNTELREINLTLDSILSDINDNHKALKKINLLEIGIGNGNKSIPIFNKYEFKNYYGIEPIESVYNIFIEMCNKYNCGIKSFNVDLKEFVTNTDKKFDVILLTNVIHFIGFDNLIEQIKYIIKPNAFIIIQNPHPKPIGWGNIQYVKDSDEFDEKKWLKFKSKLENCYSEISNSKYLYKTKSDNKYIFFVLKI